MKKFIKNSLWIMALLPLLSQATQNTASSATSDTTGSEFSGSENKTMSDNYNESNQVTVSGMQGVTQTIGGNKITAVGVRMGSRGNTFSLEERTIINKQLNESTRVIGQADMQPSSYFVAPYVATSSIEDLGTLNQPLMNKLFAIPAITNGTKAFSFTPTVGPLRSKKISVILQRKDPMSSNLQIDILRKIADNKWEPVASVSAVLPEGVESRNVALLLTELKQSGTGLFKIGDKISTITLGDEQVAVN